MCTYTNNGGLCGVLLGIIVLDACWRLGIRRRCRCAIDHGLCVTAYWREMVVWRFVWVCEAPVMSVRVLTVTVFSVWCGGTPMWGFLQCPLSRGFIGRALWYLQLYALFARTAPFFFALMVRSVSSTTSQGHIKDEKNVPSLWRSCKCRTVSCFDLHCV